jgi:ribosomal protein L16 Arg81 hydroxylase
MRAQYQTVDPDLRDYPVGKNSADNLQ